MIQGIFCYCLTVAVFEKVADKLKKFVTAHIVRPPYVFLRISLTVAVLEKVADKLKKFITAHILNLLYTFPSWDIYIIARYYN